MQTRHYSLTLLVKRYFVVAVKGRLMPTSFPEEIKRHQVQHGVLDVVDLLLER